MTSERGRGVRRWWPAVALGLVLGLGAGGRSRAGEGASAASRWVSADAVIYLELRDPSRLIDRLTDPRLRGPLYAIPSVKAAAGGGHAAKLRQVAELVAGKLGTTWEKALRDLTSGGVVFAVEADSKTEPNAYLIATPADPAFLKKASDALLELARQDATLKGGPDPVKSTEYRGLAGYQVGPKAVYGIFRDRLLIADRGDTVKLVVDRVEDGTGVGKSVDDSAEWKARRSGEKPGALAWGVARTDRLRKIDPKRFGRGDATEGANPKSKPPEALLLGGWLEALRKAPVAAASVDWSASRLNLDLTLATPKDGRGQAFQAFVPPKGSGAPPLASPPGTILSVSLWRDLAAAWESRTDLFAPEDVQNLAKLDGVAGQFFGGRDFGTGVLGALTSDWRLVVAVQDYPAMKPAPDVKLPAFALVMGVKPDDEDFAERLKVAFQSFVGLVNLGAAQSKAPPLELGSETFDGVTIATSHYMAPRKAGGAGAAAAAANPADPKEAVNSRHNFSPSAAQVGNHFVLSSSVGLARDLVKALKAPGKAGEATLVAEADGATLAGLVGLNRNRLVLQNMLEKGHDRDQAEGEVGLVESLLRYLGHGRLSVRDEPDATRLGLEFSLGK